MVPTSQCRCLRTLAVTTRSMHCPRPAEDLLLQDKAWCFRTKNFQVIKMIRDINIISTLRPQERLIWLISLQKATFVESISMAWMQVNSLWRHKKSRNSSSLILESSSKKINRKRGSQSWDLTNLSCSNKTTYKTILQRKCEASSMFQFSRCHLRCLITINFHLTRPWVEVMTYRT